VVDDEVSILDGRRVVARFRELEAELAEGADESLIRPVVKALEAEGAERAEPAMPKYVRALHPRASEPPEVVTAAKRPKTVEAMVRVALSTSVARLIRHDAVVRLGEDAEGVHQARVAARRLRSDLRTFRSLVEASWDAELREELQWLGMELGAVRDLDVLGDRLRAHASMLPDDDAMTMPKLLDRLRAQRDEARAGMLSALREDRYVVLLDRLVKAANDPAVLEDEADRRANEVVASLMRGPWDHLETACTSLAPDSADTELHAARIRAKRVRYAAEALIPVVGSPARRFAERAAALQDELGEHQDSVFAAAWLRDQAAGTSARVAFTAGELGGIEARIQRRARRRWPAAWDRLDRAKVRFW
jgi:CHAD domain-containing protein